jgi:hypothetical protein
MSRESGLVCTQETRSANTTSTAHHDISAATPIDTSRAFSGPDLPPRIEAALGQIRARFCLRFSASPHQFLHYFLPPRTASASLSAQRTPVPTPVRPSHAPLFLTHIQVYSP